MTKEDKGNVLRVFSILLFIITLGNFIYTMSNEITYSKYNQWGMVGGMTEDEERDFYQQKSIEKNASNNAKINLDKSSSLRNIFAFACILFSILIIVLSFFYNKKVGNIIFSIITILLNVLLLL